MSEIGTLFWRVKNYGISAAVKYVSSKFIKSNAENTTLVTSLSEFDVLINRGTNSDVVAFYELYEEVFKVVLQRYQNFRSEGGVFKKGIIGREESQTKFIILAYLIHISNLDLIVETGTQYGCTAFIMDEFVRRKNTSDTVDLYSFDVKHYERPGYSGNLNMVILHSPIRKKFESISLNLVNNRKSIMFFHDSDHTFENMTFEFEWAWNVLNVNYLIADDIDENSAFDDFLKRNKLTALKCKFDAGPTVGVVIRKF